MLQELGIVGRIKLYDWTLEIYGLLILVAIIGFFKIGGYINHSKFTGVLNSLKPFLKENFYQVGIHPDHTYYKDSEQIYTTFATGRINIKSFWMRVWLKPRQSLPLYLTELIFSNFMESVKAPADEVEVVITPDFAIPSFCFAIVNKIGMNEVRKDNYFLSLTKTSDNEELLPPQFVFMSESNELNSLLVDDEFKQILAQCAGSLKYLAFVDLPSNQPEKLSDFKNNDMKVLVKLNCSGFDNGANTQLFEKIFKIIDLLAAKKISVKSELVKKFDKTRETEYKKLEKLIEDNRKLQLEQDLLEKKRTEKSKVSSAEQDKIDAKMREKRERRAKNKQRMRM